MRKMFLQVVDLKENWGMVEELADKLGAATACSKPVSDLGELHSNTLVKLENQ